MLFLVVLGLIGLIAIGFTAYAVLTDGYGPVRTGSVRTGSGQTRGGF
ncbi:hypothetical protein [Subtercola boreus]|nr:hypothetical protein [Subtercola boreus]